MIESDNARNSSLMLAIMSLYVWLPIILAVGLSAWELNQLTRIIDLIMAGKVL